jgi:hypothetical protein
MEPEEHTLECSGRNRPRLRLRLVLLGLEEDRRSEQRTEFECSCGKGLIFSDKRLNEDVLEFKRLMWGALESQAVDIGGLYLGTGSLPSLG